jgi:hypothetical protein
MKNAFLIVAAGALFVAITACSETNSSADDTDTPLDTDAPVDSGAAPCAASAAAFCQAWGPLETKCYGTPDPAAATASCLDYMEHGDSLNCTFLSVVVDCMNTVACDADQDLWQYCVFEGLFAIEPAGWDIAGIKALMENDYNPDVDWMALFGGISGECLARHVACDTGGEGSFQDDECVTSAALSAASQQAVQSCLTRECDAIGDCIRDAGAFIY